MGLANSTEITTRSCEGPKLYPPLEERIIDKQKHGEGGDLREKTEDLCIKNTLNWVVSFQIVVFLSSPLFGEDEPILTHICQRGWFNHQLVKHPTLSLQGKHSKAVEKFTELLRNEEAQVGRNSF